VVIGITGMRYGGYKYDTLWLYV